MALSEHDSERFGSSGQSDSIDERSHIDVLLFGWLVGSPSRCQRWLAYPSSKENGVRFDWPCSRMVLSYGSRSGHVSFNESFQSIRFDTRFISFCCKLFEFLVSWLNISYYWFQVVESISMPPSKECYRSINHQRKVEYVPISWTNILGMKNIQLHRHPSSSTDSFTRWSACSTSSRSRHPTWQPAMPSSSLTTGCDRSRSYYRSSTLVPVPFTICAT